MRSRAERKEKVKKITCAEAKKLIGPYLEGTLTDRSLASFLYHVDNCSRCYDELETNFMINRTVAYLNEEDVPASLNLRPLLQEDLKEQTAVLVHKHRMRRLWRGVVVLTLVLAALLVMDVLGVFRITEYLAQFL